jgi:hypothetical protein
MVAGIPILSFIFWLWVFATLNNPEANTGKQSDSLSGLSYDKTAVNSDRGPNPNAPYFVGFNVLSGYGLPSKDIKYIKDVITNDTLYRKKVIYAKISYVKDSFIPPKNVGLKTNYGFRYGINDGDIQTIRAESDLSDNSITIQIMNGSTTVFKKRFIEYSDN